MDEPEWLAVRMADGSSATWRVEYEFDDDCRLSLIDPRGHRYDAGGQDLYDCLKQIRRRTDGAGILLCCNGARRNTRPSGFMSQHTGASSIYRVYRWRSGVPPCDLVYIFGYAPPRAIVTVEEQEAHLEKVDRHLSSNVVFLNPMFWICFGYRELYYRVQDALAKRRPASTDRNRRTEGDRGTA
ncbi:hypothetical protein [Catellatospora vulcania]|uniref:hypothetical protein n=1 Tax=Catellatospora vulcania TaxID=1460450 RepID=UPI0012D494E2|nr:hypothetical protein [Catellatospora vulcania]